MEKLLFCLETLPPALFLDDVSQNDLCPIKKRDDEISLLQHVSVSIICQTSTA